MEATTTNNNHSSESAVAALVPSWLQESRPAHHFWAFLVEPLYEPITNRALPRAITLPVVVSLALILLTRLVTIEGAAESSPRLRAKRRARVKQRRRALWARLCSLPVYILFAYVATVTSQTAVECGFLRLPPKISEADWFQEHVRWATRTLVLLLKLTGLGIVILSIVFSDPALDWGLQKLATTATADASGAGDAVGGSTSVATAIEQAPKPLRWSVALVTACDLFFCAASYLSVLFSALLLYASLLVWMTAGVPWIVYATQVNERLRKSFLTRYLNNEIEKFFVELNLLLCSWSLLIKTRGRLQHHTHLWRLGQMLRFPGLLRRLRMGRAPKNTPDVMPVVEEALHSAATRARASMRNKRKRERERRKRLGQVEMQPEQ